MNDRSTPTTVLRIIAFTAAGVFVAVAALMLWLVIAYGIG